MCQPHNHNHNPNAQPVAHGQEEPVNTVATNTAATMSTHRTIEMKMRGAVRRTIEIEQSHWPRRPADVQLSTDVGAIVGYAQELHDLLREALARVEIAHSEGSNILAAWVDNARRAVRRGE